MLYPDRLTPVKQIRGDRVAFVSTGHDGYASADGGLVLEPIFLAPVLLLGVGVFLWMTIPDARWLAATAILLSAFISWTILSDPTEDMNASGCTKSSRMQANWECESDAIGCKLSLLKPPGCAFPAADPIAAQP